LPDLGLQYPNQPPCKGVDVYTENPAEPLSFYKDGHIKVEVANLAVAIDVIYEDRIITMDDEQYANCLEMLSPTAFEEENSDYEEVEDEPMCRTLRGRQVRLPSRYRE
jgi:hypothetical protein